MAKHFHVITGLAGGYIPNTNYTYDTKAFALNAAVDLANEYRDNGEKVRGSRKQGFWMARESAVTPGVLFDYIEVSGPCFDTCEDWD